MDVVANDAKAIPQANAAFAHTNDRVDLTSLRPARVPGGIQYQHQRDAPIDLKVVSWGKGSLTDQRSYTFSVPPRKETYIYVIDEGLHPSYRVGGILYHILRPSTETHPGLFVDAQG